MKRPKLRGNCYVTCEALWHLLGGMKSNWTPHVYRFASGETHWFLRHNVLHIVLDPTRKQFTKLSDWEMKNLYYEARGCGFLTKKPSRRAAKLMKEMLWQSTPLPLAD